MSRRTESSSARRPKKAYRAPTLRTYGRINDLTLTEPDGPNFDGGGGANIYADGVTS
jgi:hypothetical protein